MRVSRPEILVCCGVGTMLVSVVASIVWSRMLHRRDLAAIADMKAIAAAVSSFRKHYDGQWPTRMEVEYDFRFGLSEDISNNEIFHVLRAVDGPGNENHEINPDQQVFLEVASAGSGRSGLNRRGEFVDPWGQPYQMVFDLNEDGLCDLARSVHRVALQRKVAVWSYGPDQRPNTPDDRLGWQVREEYDVRDTITVEPTENP